MATTVCREHLTPALVVLGRCNAVGVARLISLAFWLLSFGRAEIQGKIDCQRSNRLRRLEQRVEHRCNRYIERVRTIKLEMRAVPEQI
jgi:hypothetical protein